MLFDEGGRILLIRFVAVRPDGEFVFWALPGGEIEAGETETEAAARELREELGIVVEAEGAGLSRCEPVLASGGDAGQYGLSVLCTVLERGAETDWA